MTDERGSITTEVVLLTPVLMLLLAFVVMTGRVGVASGAVTDAAHQAARAASLRASPAEAAADAETTAAANLSSAGVSCAELAVEVDTSRFARGGDVAVSLTCTADLGDLAFVGLPGSRTLSARAVEVIDVYRGGG